MPAFLYPKVTLVQRFIAYIGSMSSSELFEKMEHLRKEVEGIFNAHSTEVLNAKPSHGGWSALQVMYHLWQAETLSIASIEKRLAKNKERSAQRSGVQAWFRSFLLNQALKSRKKFKAPKRLGEMPDELLTSDVLMKLQLHREHMRQFLGGLDKADYGKLLYTHPRAGELSLQSAMEFMFWHFKRHMEQIKRTIADVQKQS
jgi:hypothetical protein